jgi:hypothetical protein
MSFKIVPIGPSARHPGLVLDAASNPGRAACLGCQRLSRHSQEPMVLALLHETTGGQRP